MSQNGKDLIFNSCSCVHITMFVFTIIFAQEARSSNPTENNGNFALQSDSRTCHCFASYLLLRPWSVFGSVKQNGMPVRVGVPGTVYNAVSIGVTDTF